MSKPVRYEVRIDIADGLTGGSTAHMHFYTKADLARQMTVFRNSEWMRSITVTKRDWSK